MSPRLRDRPAVVAAAHQACDALVQLAAAGYEQICQAHRAGRLHSPTRTLPEDHDIPYPFGPTPGSRVSLLETYRKAAIPILQRKTMAALAASREYEAEI